MPTELMNEPEIASEEPKLVIDDTKSVIALLKLANFVSEEIIEKDGNMPDDARGKVALVIQKLRDIWSL